MNGITAESRYTKVGAMLAQPGLSPGNVEDLQGGKHALHGAKARLAEGHLGAAREAYGAAADAFERVGATRPGLIGALEARLVRFSERRPALAAPTPRRPSSALGLAQTPPKPPEVDERSLQEKAREMWSSRVLLQRNLEATTPYVVEFGGLPFVVNPNVFSPAVFNDTFFFAANMPFRAGERFLEVGSGTGLIAALAAIKGASFVVAVDVNPGAVRNTRENLAAHGLGAVSSVREGDVFSPLGSDERFDTIWWNVPFMHCDKEDLTMLEKALYDPGYEALERYLAGAKQHLRPDGHVLIGFSDTHGHMEVLEALAARYGWTLRVLAKQETLLPPSAEGAARFVVQLFEAIPCGAAGAA